MALDKELVAALEVFKQRNDLKRWHDCCVNLYQQNKAEGLPYVLNFRNEMTRRARAGEDMAASMSWVHKSYLLTALDDLDSYLIFLEHRRTPNKQFYLPRRNVLLPLVHDLQDLADGEIDFLGISLPPRVGKALSFDTPVLTRNGWKEHGDLTIRDEVIAPDGHFVKVLAIHPVCEMEYEVSFSNGEKVVCHGNHEWTVLNRHKQKVEVLETRSMINDLENDLVGRGHRYAYLLLPRENVVGEHKELPIDPYTLGAWLGDGANRNPTICNAKTDKVIIDTIVENGYEMAWDTVHKDTGVHYYGFRKLREQLQTVNMCHSRYKSTKHIPEEYFTASIEQRLELLAGLIDTDGTLREKNRYDFCTAEERLRDDFVALVSTFGWRCSVTEYKPTTSSSGVKAVRSHWRIGFNPTMFIPCKVRRKQLFEYSPQRKVAITAIKSCVGKQGNCITVEGGEYCVGRKLIPTHNSTLCIFFMTWIMGKRPDVASVMSGHSDKLTDGFYREVLSVITDPTTYAWNDVFPTVKLVDQSAKNETIDLNRKKRFPTFTARSISGTLTGAVEIGTGGVLYSDDLIEDLEESLNPERLQAKYDAYLNQLKDRKKEGACELMVGTRWNTLDVLGRVEDQYAGNPRYRFRVIPALREDGESNFDYPFSLGFSKEYYLDMKASIDDATWCAKYMGQPYIREGLLYHRDELRRFYELPEGEPDAVLAVCDTAEGGGDDTFLPVFAQYGPDHYCIDCVCSNALPEVTDVLCADVLVKNKVKMCQFESNSAGGRTADKVQEKVKAQGGHTHITKKRTTANKQTKIIVNSSWVKEHCLFLDDAVIPKGGDYQKMMNKLTMYAITGRNKTDDVPDGCAQYALFVQSLEGNVAVVQRRLF